MIHNVKILFFICFFTACSSTEQKEIFTAGELLRQAAFYGERLQFLPALETYQQAIKLAEKEKDSTVFFPCLPGNGKNLSVSIFKTKGTTK